MKQKNKTNNYNEILKEINKFRDKDYTFASGRILGSMCTQPHPIAKKAYMDFLETNLGDPELFPGTREIESRYTKFVSDLLYAPKNSAGLNVSGGTEGNITAIWLAKKLTGKKEVIIPESAHFSFKKIESLMDIKTIPVPLNKEYHVDANAVKKKINEKTAAVVGIAGSTELGTIDPIPELSEICHDRNIFLHIDAAFGGFVIPFLKKLDYNVPDFDFKLECVSTISIDSHKMGYSAIPLGTLVMRDKKWLEEISVESPYISSNKQAGILGTRSGGPIAAAYAVSKILGIDGYKKLVKECMETTQYTEERIREIGLSLAVKPSMNVIGVKLKHLTEIVDKLLENRWRVNKIDRISCIRIVLMPHVTKEIIDEFIPDLKKTCKEVGEI